MSALLDYLADNILFTLVLILAVGLALGKIRVLGVSLGAAAVLFVALGLATANPEIQIPPLLYQLGLAMFVYAIGLQAGPAFFREFSTRGWKITGFALALIAVLVLVGYLLIRGFDLDVLTGAGMFAGALSSTPGMAAIVSMVDPAEGQAPVVGYSLAYPGAVIGTILVAAVGAAVLKVDHRAEAASEGMLTEPLVWRGVEIGPGISGRIGDLRAITGEQIIATRIADDEHHHELADPTTSLREGMRLVVNGTESAVDRSIGFLGTGYDAKIEDTELVYSRFTVSSPEVAGRRVGDLDTVEHGFLIARVRTGDSEAVPSPSTVLNYSDRVRVIAAPGRMQEIRNYLGDSERKLGDVDLLPFAAGLTLGLALGLIPVPMPGGTVLTLGFGGGPIVAGLVLGALNRTGSITWQLPFHANRTIQT
ncbi:MAG TPA: TrkA C-terminal domain-containing protein, partial [Corynebacterium sp.]|nr:TrkA C-terminal domain-containing protein [Corynebacterium sp.]